MNTAGRISRSWLTAPTTRENYAHFAWYMPYIYFFEHILQNWSKARAFFVLQGLLDVKASSLDVKGSSLMSTLSSLRA